MAEGVVLYDVDKGGYPTEKNAQFRTLQLFRCEWCGAKTNKAFFNGHVIVACPYHGECWHHEVEGKKQLLTQPHPASYRKELNQEITSLLGKHRPTDDVTGNVTGVRRPRPTNAIRGYKEGCKHRSTIWPAIA